jgi:hypothetical protein
VGQQNEYRNDDGVGAVKGPVEARQGMWGARTVVVLGVSLALAVVAYFVLQAWFFPSLPSF